MRLYFIRHGDKEAGEFFSDAIGHQDNPLSVRGQDEARRLLRYFAGRRVDRIFASRYGRTSGTAGPLAAERGISPVVDPRLDEIDVGARDKLDDDAFGAAYPGFMAEYRMRRSDFRYPDGECGMDVFARIDPFLSERVGEGLDSVCFTHDGFIRILMCRLLGLPPWERFRFEQDTCGILELDLAASPESVAAGKGEPARPDLASLFSIVRFNHVVDAV